MNTKYNLFIVIPVPQRKNFTEACLLSLQKQTINNFHIVVVDDGSTDGTNQMVASKFSEVHLLRGDGNLWWTGATNMGVMYALDQNADYIMTLNDDTLPPPTFMENMLLWAEKMPNGLFGAMAVNSDTKEIEYWGEKINWLTAKFVPIMDKKDAATKKGIQEVTHFPGRGLLIPAHVFKKIGIYDAARLPHYAADYDFTHRATRAGYKIYCNYDAKLFIYPEASGAVNLKKKRTLKNYYKHLFGIKGAANLVVFTRYAINNCPKKYLPLFLIQGYIRRVIGYWLH